MSLPKGINIDEPRYPQNTYANRAKHFLIVTNPLVRFSFVFKLFLGLNFIDFSSIDRTFSHLKNLLIVQLELWGTTKLESRFLTLRLKMSCGKRRRCMTLPSIPTLVVWFWRVLRPPQSYLALTLFLLFYREDDLSRANERSSADEHEWVTVKWSCVRNIIDRCSFRHHGHDDDVLSFNSCRHLLAMDESVVQRSRQLHKPFRCIAYWHQSAVNVLLPSNRWSARHSSRLKSSCEGKHILFSSSSL